MVRYLVIALLLFAGRALSLPLYFAPPTERENGAAFYTTEIDYYELYRNGALYLTVTPTAEDGSAETEVLDDGDYQALIVDLEGLRSALGDIVSINNAIRAAPNAPGLSRKR